MTEVTGPQCTSVSQIESETSLPCPSKVFPSHQGSVGERGSRLSSVGRKGISTYQLALVRGWICFVAIGIQEELGVAVDGDEGLDVPVALHKVHDGLDLHFGICKLAMVSVRAGVVAGSCHCGRRGG